jgi:SAM-dependent methyltransferase
MSAKCLACGSAHLVPCLNLGDQPLANEFKNSETEHEETYPLAVVRCEECDHLQLDYFIDPDLMFKNYLYVSGTSSTYREYLAWFASMAGRKGDRVLDIGCNDGTQLDMFKDIGCDTWGVDPAENLWPVSSAKHKVTLGYFDANYNPGVMFDVMNAQNVFAHNRDPLTFLANAKRFMHPGTKLYIQTSQADMVLNGEFDTIYHEHINFFNVLSFKKLTERAGLVLLDVTKTKIHGTSYMFVVGIEGTPGESVARELAREEEAGLHKAATYNAWAINCHKFAEKVRADLNGSFVVAYGAAAKGNTMLNFLKFKPNVIIDDNPLKQGKFSPGVRARVAASDYLNSLPDDQPVVFLPLAWNLFEEIKSKILKTRNNPIDTFYNLKF